MDEGEEALKPCIQDRLRSISSRSRDIFASWPIICLSIILIIFILPEIINRIMGREIINIFPEFTLEIKIDIILGFSIVIFSSMQYILARTRNKIEDARNELEKAYGPLYTIINRSKYEEVGKIILEIMDLDEFDKNELDEILSTYPFMFPSEIYEYWRNKIKIRRSSRIHGGSYYGIPLEFRDMINKEYDVRRRRYDKLIGK